MLRIKFLSVISVVILFSLFLAILAKNLFQDPQKLPSALLEKNIPNFRVPTLDSEKIFLESGDFIGHFSILNVWASWCASCIEEHKAWMKISQQDRSIFLYGLNYKDQKIAAQKWLEQHGNPYRKSGIDFLGDVAIDLGVYGTPETFVIDPSGKVLYRYVGVVTDDVWDHVLKPLIKKNKGAHE